MKNAIAYLRISKQNETSSIHSRGTQIDMIESYAESHDIEILEWFEDINVSGGKENRENLQRAVNLAKRTGSYLIVKDLSRLSRKASHCLALLAEVNVIDTTLGLECDDKVLAILALANQWERETCSVRAKQTVSYLRKQDPDRVFGNVENLKRGRHKSASTRKSQADEYALLLEPLVMTPETLVQCAYKLERLGIKTQRGGDRWYPTSVRNLRNRIISLRES